MKYRDKETAEVVTAVQYDGTSASVEQIMEMLEKTSGIMNTSDGYMLIDGIRIERSEFVVKDTSKFWDWLWETEEEFIKDYEKLDQ